jgi:PAS domain S-box-containing protein
MPRRAIPAALVLLPWGGVESHSREQLRPQAKDLHAEGGVLVSTVNPHDSALTTSAFDRFYRNHDAVMLLMDGETGHLLDASEGAVRFYGYSLPQIRSMNIHDINQLSPEQVDVERRKALTEERAYFVFPHRLARGEIRTVEVHSSPVLVGDEPCLLSVIHDVSDRVRVEADLRESEARLRAIAANTPDHVLMQDMDLRYTLIINPQLGLTEADYLGRTDADILEPEDAERLTAIKRRVVETGERVDLEVPLVNLEGKREIFSGAYVPVFDADGEPNGLVGYFRNVTAHREAEEGLVQSEDKFRYLFDHSPVAKSLTLPNGEINVNQAFLDMLGYSREDLHDDATWRDLTHPDDVMATEAAMAALSSGAQSTVRFEKRYLHKDGSIVWVEVISRLRWNPDGSPDYFMTTFFDVTERKAAESERVENEARLQALLDDAPYGAHIYELRAEDRLVFIGYNRRAAEILGMDHSVLLGSTLEEAFPGNAGTATAEAYRRVARDGGTWEADEYVYDADNLAGVFEVYAFSFGANRVSVFFRDVTEKRRLERELERTNATLQAAMDQSSAGIAIADAPDGRLRYVNDAGLGIRGGDRQTIVDGVGIEQYVASWQMLDLDGRPLEPDEVPLARAILYGEQASREFIIRRQDGEDRIVIGNAAPITDGSGNVEAAMVVFTDLTDIKRAESDLVDTNERLEVLLKSLTETLGRVGETRDPYTQGHEERVAALSRALAVELDLPTDEIDALETAALVHDIGKLSVPAEILSKPGSLSDVEFSLIKRHSQAGYDILENIPFPWPIAEIVLQHHERMDGSGYPNGLHGDEILLNARIIAVADVVEAMSSHRPYRPALGLQVALDEVTNASGKYDLDVVAACERLNEDGRLAALVE